LILFCDTSAWVKRYLVEDGGKSVVAAVQVATVVALARVTWVESMSAFARREREQPAATRGIAAARVQFRLDWPQCLVLKLTRDVTDLAGEYCEAFALRAADSVQLTSAQVLRQRVGEDVAFLGFDQRLAKAAALLSLPAPVIG